MIVGSQLEAAQLENVSSNPATQAQGMIYQNTTDKKPVIDDGDDVTPILMEKHLDAVMTSQNLKGRVAAVDTYANLAARTRVAGLTYLASDLQTYFVDNGTELIDGGGGLGSPFTYHVENFEVTNASNTSVTGTATVSNETTAPLFGTRSLKITHSSGAVGSRVLVDKTIQIQAGQRGVLNGVEFAIQSPTVNADAVYRVRVLQSNDDVAYTDMVEFIDVSATINMSVVQLLFTPDTSSTSLKFVIEIVTETTQASEDLIIDNFSFTSNPIKNASFERRTPWRSFVPTLMNGLGAVSSVNFLWRRKGSILEFFGSFITGTVSASEAQIGFPSEAGAITVKSGLSRTVCGNWGTSNNTTSSFYPNVLSGDNFINLGRDRVVADLASSILNNNEFQSFFVRVPIQEWSDEEEGALTDTGSAVVFSPFKTEITSGAEYKTGDVIDGKDVYAQEMVATGSFTSSTNIGNINTSYKITRMSGAINSNFFGVTGLNYTDPSGNTHRVEQNTVNGNIVCVIGGPTVTSINAKVEYTK